jgi:hypothetical protein
VSGPNARAAEVDAAMDGLLAGMMWGANPPRAAEPLSVRPCAAGEGSRDARLLPDPPGAEIAAHGFLATFDGGGIEGMDGEARRDLPSRVPPNLCLSSHLDQERGSMQILRGPAGEPRSIDGRTRLVALLADNGMALEVVHASNLQRHLVLLHRMGETNLLGGYDGVPSDRQVADILYGRDQAAARARVTVRFPAEGGPELHILTPAPTATGVGATGSGSGSAVPPTVPSGTE